MTEQPAADALGRFLIGSVRDPALSSLARALDSRRGLVYDRLRHHDANSLAAILDAAPVIVDLVIDHLLTAIESSPNPEVMIGVRLADETLTDVRTITDGLAGELYGQRGWLQRFSSQSPGLA